MAEKKGNYEFTQDDCIQLTKYSRQGCFGAINKRVEKVEKQQRENT
jgi:hypothetical protein